MKVKTFLAETRNGYEEAFESLDRQVMTKLSDDVIIHTLTDTLYKGIGKMFESGMGRQYGEHIARVIVYDDKK